MSDLVQTLLEAPAGYRSEHVARILWQLDDQSRRLTEATRGLGADTLGWQPKPGMNTIGMLLAHIAVAEAHLTEVGLEGKPDSDVSSVIGIDVDDDGLPLPPDGRPPEALRGKELPFFDDLLARARKNTKRVAHQLSDQDLLRRVTRKRPDGSTRIFNVDWILYHLLEHEAGHFGQILMLVHMAQPKREPATSAAERGGRDTSPATTEAHGLAPQAAERFAEMVLAAIHREYPSHILHLLQSDADVRPPRELTPVFYGSFDWHSAVHGHWSLARLLRCAPGGHFAERARAALDQSLTPAKLAREAEYLLAPGRESFERPYGLAWLLQLAAELREWDDGDAASWRSALAPLERLARARLDDLMAKLPWPVRSGVHSQTAFAAGLAHDWARAAGDDAFAKRLEERALHWYESDVSAPIAYEPSGHDFLSPALGEADLMRRLLPRERFATWLDRFLPDLDGPGARAWLMPVASVDPKDGHLAHLEGLNLSRAWMLEGIAAGLPAADPRVSTLRAAAGRHAEAGLAAVTGEHYAGGHWLSSFALYLTTARGLGGGP